jgi:hypothetical protein
MSEGEPRIANRLFRGYGPLVGFVVAMVIVANFIPTQREKVRSDAPTDSSSTPVAVQGESESTSTTSATGATSATDAASAAAGSGSGAAGGNRPGVAAGRPSSDATAGRVPCANQKIQVPADPYSPNCFTWTPGTNNGGATSPGVTATSIKVTVRIGAFLDGLNNALSKAAGAKELAESPETVKRTFLGLTKYLNDHYQFYGRKIDLVIYDGKGDVLDEALGAGQEGAQQDARRVAKDIGAFADASAVTVPYADALTQQHVVNIGAPYVSKDWLVAHRPYSWTPLTDGSTVVSAVASYYITKMAGKTAAWAGGDLQGKQRRAAIIAPDNSWYQESVNAGVRVLRQSGHGADLFANLQYKLDLNAMSNQAASLLPKLKQSGATTILCGCDPVLLSFLTAQAKQQQYFPEWVETGVAYTDQDLVGQLFEPSVWAHAFGVSFAGSTVPLKGSFAYQAYKSSGMPGEPSIAAQLIFDQLQVLAIGLQMAGPNLNPITFEAGMFAYLPRSGVSGRWDFGPGDYSTSSDAREIYWDPNMTSIQNGKKGGWRESPIPRVPIGHWPPGDPEVPKR